MEHDPRLIILIIIPVTSCLMLLGYLRYCQKQIDKEIKQIKKEKMKNDFINHHEKNK